MEDPNQIIIYLEDIHQSSCPRGDPGQDEALPHDGESGLSSRERIEQGLDLFVRTTLDKTGHIH